MRTAFHTSREFIGDEVMFDRGGYYEKTDSHGTVEQRHTGAVEGFVGFEHSNTEQLAASATPEGGVFAQCHNMANDIGGFMDPDTTVTFFVYKLQKAPDIDLRNNVVGDFAMLDEVRYNNPEDDPIEGSLIHSLTFSAQIVNDVQLAYLPPNPHIISEWGEAVKESIRTAIETGVYESPSESLRPDVDAYS